MPIYIMKLGALVKNEKAFTYDEIYKLTHRGLLGTSEFFSHAFVEDCMNPMDKNSVDELDIPVYLYVMRLERGFTDSEAMKLPLGFDKIDQDAISIVGQVINLTNGFPAKCIYYHYKTDEVEIDCPLFFENKILSRDDFKQGNIDIKDTWLYKILMLRAKTTPQMLKCGVYAVVTDIVYENGETLYLYNFEDGTTATHSTDLEEKDKRNVVTHPTLKIGGNSQSRRGTFCNFTTRYLTGHYEKALYECECQICKTRNVLTASQMLLHAKTHE